MKHHLVLAGKSLAAAGLTGVVLYVVGTATQRSWPFWPYLIFIGMLIAGGVLYFLGQNRSASVARLADADATENLAESQSGPAFTDRWRHTPNGGEAPGLMMISHKGFSHRGYMRQPSEDRPPYVRIGMLVACDALGPAPTTSDLRDRFLTFLGRQPIRGLIRGLSYVGEDLSWRSYASNGRINNEAVLTDSREQQEAPVASAMMILNEAGMPRWGHDDRLAELVLHIEPRGKDGKPASPTNFKAWHDTLVRALAVAGAFAQFLSRDIGVVTYDHPATQLGVELSAYRSITELVDTEGIPTVAGSWQSNSFLGYMIAERNGKQATEAAVELLTRVCDHALHLHDYEEELAKLRSTEQPTWNETKAAVAPQFESENDRLRTQTLSNPAARIIHAATRPAVAATVIIAVICIIGVIIVFVVRPGHKRTLASPESPSHPHATAAQGAFTYPLSGATNIPKASILHATGTAQDIQKGHHLWLFLWFYDNQYYGGHDLILTNGKWSGHIYIGGSKQAGQQFTLWLLDLGPEGWHVWNSNGNGQQYGFNGWRFAPDVSRLASVSFTVQ